MNKVAIIYYHRINEKKADYNFTNVQPHNFSDHMKILHDRYDVISIDEIYNGDAFKHNRNAIVITFDDGYRDVLYNAVPVMEAYEFPYTCFITTGNIYTGKCNWTDVIIKVAFEPEEYHESIQLNLNGETLFFNTGNLDERVGFYKGLKELFMKISYDEWRCVLSELTKWAGINEADHTYKIMDVREIQKVRGHGASIGAHTITHPFLSCMGDEDIMHEVSDSKETLENILGESVHCFSYPFGDCPKKVRPMLDECGYQIAVTSNKGLVTSASDVMYLPRIAIRNYSGMDFINYLESIFNEQ